ncbi:MAG: hypothetical protein GTO02_12530, partial [Candidatus Dadabacteria bacterium]|nr:hypothetical protein [Candidatus Dadabacteria bacterium]
MDFIHGNQVPILKEPRTENLLLGENMESSIEMTNVSESTLEQLFPQTLTDTSCVYIEKEREIWVATEMCAQYIESNVDSIVVRENGKALGIVGGYD